MNYFEISLYNHARKKAKNAYKSSFSLHILNYPDKHTKHPCTEAKRRREAMLSFLNTYVFGVAVPLLIALCGGFFLFRIRGFFLFHPLRAVKEMLAEEKDVRGEAIGKKKTRQSPFRAVSLALAGTLGIGNIAGVTVAIAVGGAGSIFWMWVSASRSGVIS